MSSSRTRILWVLLISAIGILLANRFGSHWILNNLGQFLPVALALAALAVLLSGKHFRLRLAAIGLCLVLVGLMVPLWASRPQSAVDDRLLEPFRLYHLNIYARNPDFGAVAREVIETDADLVTLVEVTAKARLPLEYLSQEYPHIHSWPGSALHAGITIYSRWPIVGKDIIGFGQTGMPLPVVTIQAPSGFQFSLLAVHLPSPINAARTFQRDAVLELLPSKIWETPRPLVAVGDFNTTPWMPAMERFRRESGLYPARLRPAPATWPSELPIVGLPIDQLLISDGLRVTGLVAREAPGSDHRAIEAIIEGF